MAGAIGEKIGEGAMAEVYAWAPGQVLKLFKPTFRRRVGWWEAQMTRAVFAAGGPAPEVLDEMILDGRYGIVMPRLHGPTLLQRLQTDAATPQEAGEILATLALAVHRTPTPADVLSVRGYMEASLQPADGQVPDHIAQGVLALIDRLPPDDGLSHCDLHPGNVIMTAEGPKLIDWTGAKRGGASLDLACCHFLLTELTPEGFGDAARQSALNMALQSAYMQLTGASRAALTAAIDLHLPIARVFFLLGAAARPATRERLLERLEADFAR